MTLRASARLPGDPRTLVLGGLLLGIAAWSWVVVARTAASPMAAMPGMGMSGMSGTVGTAPTGPEAAGFVAAWGVMMAAMMLPSATPMILLYGTVTRRLRADGERAIPPALFATIYLALWTATGIPVYAGYVAAAALATRTTWFTGMTPWIVALILIAAGAYQFTDIKRACLASCESPLDFLMSRWRSGYRATLRLAVRHAAYCIGCCWALMVILVAAGSMGIRWVIGLAIVVFAEKVFGWSGRTSRAIGVGLIGFGLVVAVWPQVVGMSRY